MKSLYLRIWLTVVAVLVLFALGSAWVVDRHIAQEKAQFDRRISEELTAWGELLQNSLPEASQPVELQAEALREWSRRLRLPVALDDAQGRRIAESDSYKELSERSASGPWQAVTMPMSDGRKLTVLRFVKLGKREWTGPRDPLGQPPGDGGGPRAPGRPPHEGFRPDQPPRPDLLGPHGPKGLDGAPPVWFGPFLPPELTKGLNWVVLPAALLLAVAAGAWPVVRRLTRRLEELKRGVTRFGAGNLGHRLEVEGRDEVASVAEAFNQAASRIETLVRANQSLLANASHELRSPLARLKMATTLLLELPAGAPRQGLATEIQTNIAELDALVEEVLLSSRLEAGAPMQLDDGVDLLGVAAEEAARVGAQADGQVLVVRGSERLLRRAVRNLLENARRYGGDEVWISVDEGPSGAVQVKVADRGPGVPPEERERIFEPFYRMSGHAEREGGVGLGLALVRQIAQRHGGDVCCTGRDGGGTCFIITLPGSRRVD